MTVTNSIADINMDTIKGMVFNFDAHCFSAIKTQFVAGCIADAYYANQNMDTILKILMRDSNSAWFDNAIATRHFANIAMRNALLTKVYQALTGSLIPDHIVTTENGFFESMRFHEMAGKEDMEMYLIAMERLKSKQLNCYDALVKISSTVETCDLTKFTTLLFLLEKQALDDMLVIMAAGVKSVESGLCFNAKMWASRLSDLQIYIMQK